MLLSRFEYIDRGHVRAWPFVILGFQEIKFLIVYRLKRVKIRHYTGSYIVIAIQWDIAQLWRFNVFFKMAAVRHLVFLRSRFSTTGTVHRITMCHRAKFWGDRSNRCADMVIFDIFIIATVRHLGFVMSKFREPTKSIWWLLSLYKMGIDAVVSIICKCWYLTSLAWKFLFTPPKWRFWGLYTGKWGAALLRSQGHLLA